MAAAVEMSGLARLMRPRTVAIVGATPEPGTIGGAVLANLERCSYQGDIHLVSRRAKEINGRPCVAAIDDLPDGIDAAVLVVPQQAVVDAVAACGRRGIGGAVVFASGFAEVGDDGRAEQERLVQAARTGNVRLLGPNCIGFTNFADGVALTFETIAPETIADRPSVGVVTQSGALAGALRIALSAKALGVSHAISTGNEADLTAEDFIAFLLDDPQTRAVALFLEQIRRPQTFLSLAARARALRKPIILLHPGKSARARSSASTHTGALAGDYAVMSALLRHEAVVLVDTIDELIDAADLLARAAPPTGGVGILTNSGAIKGFALDFAETIDLDIPAPSPATRDALQAALPAFAAPDNPFDVTAQVIKDLGIWTRAANALVADPAIGSLAVLAVPGAPKQAIDKGQVMLSAIVASGKPAVVAALGDESPIPVEFYSMFRERGIPVFRSPERALRALAHATRYGRALATLPRSAPSITTPALPYHGTLPEYVGKAYLAALGVTTPKGKLARDLAAAKATATANGYPVALKAQASTLSHKSDRGGVILGIESEHALASAWDEMHAALGGVALDGILVERMVKGGLEMIVGARRDPGWGPVVMVGLGGIFVETFKDVRLMPPWLSKERIIEECYQLKGAAMLRGTRGRSALDVEALADVVLRVAAAMMAQPEITEIDVNPLTVLPAGQGAIALDALIVAHDEATESGQTMICTAWGRDGRANTLVGSEAPPQPQDADNSELIWTIEADSWNEAMQKYYALQGWGLYKPMA
jgi:acetate---CoA ligase (ADP-forming)